MSGMHSTQTLYDELSRGLIEVNKMIRSAEEGIREWGGDPATTTDGKFNFVMAPMYATKAQLLLGMATLKATKVK